MFGWYYCVKSIHKSEIVVQDFVDFVIWKIGFSECTLYFYGRSHDKNHHKWRGNCNEVIRSKYYLTSFMAFVNDEINWIEISKLINHHGWCGRHMVSLVTKLFWTWYIHHHCCQVNENRIRQLKASEKKSFSTFPFQFFFTTLRPSDEIHSLLHTSTHPL